MIRWEGYAASTEEKGSACRLFGGKTREKRLLERRRHRWEHNIEMNLRQAVGGGMEWIYLA
jgi:hypothetical protein